MTLSKLETAAEIDCLSLNSLNQKLLISGNQVQCFSVTSKSRCFQKGTLFCNDVESREVIWTAEFEGAGIGALEFHPIQEHCLFVALGTRLIQIDNRMPTQLTNNNIANPIQEYNMKPNIQIFLFCRLELSEDEINSLSICPEGQVLVAGDDEGCVQVVDLSVNSKKMSIQGHQNICSSVCVSPYCENEVFSGGMDCHVKSWDLDAGIVFWDQTMDAFSQQQQQMMNPPMVHDVTCPEASAWSGLLAAARGDGVIFLQLETPDEEQETGII